MMEKTKRTMKQYNMNYLPKDTLLGELNEIAVYEFYDRPCLYSCRNTMNIYYLSVLMAEDETESIWLFAPMSKGYFDRLQQGDIDFRDAYIENEFGFVYQLEDRGKKGVIVQQINCDDLILELLPSAGEKLNYKSDNTMLERVKI